MAEAPAPAEQPTEAPATVSAEVGNAVETAAAELAAPAATDPSKMVSSPGKGDKSPTKKTALDHKYERLSGTVTSYDGNIGYVTSDSFPDTIPFRRDKVMPEFEAHPFSAEERIEFDVQTDENGRAHAVMTKPFVHRKPHDCIGQRLRGYVRRCAERWGFLNCPQFDGDLFVHRDNLLLVPGQAVEGQPPLRTGQAVTFDVAEDDRRRAVARQITTQALPRSGDMIGHGRLHGTIRSFQGAWGFIVSESFAGDLFVHRDSFNIKDPQVQEGMIVAFEVERDQRRKGSKDRLVARKVDILGMGDASQQAMMPQAYGGMQQPMMDPSAYMAGALSPQAGFAPPMAQMYYPQLDPGLAGAYAQPYPYAQPYLQQPVMQAQMPQVLPQPQYTLPGAAAMQRPPFPQAQSYLPAGVVPATDITPPVTVGQAAVAQPTVDVATAAQQPGAEAQQLLHIAMHDWDPDQEGQLYVVKGTLLNVSYEAKHGWVYAGIKQIPGSAAAGEPPQEGWLPKAVVKKVSLCKVMQDWPEEGESTLGVANGEVIAVSKEADRGWVFGERIGPRQEGRRGEGWLPKKVLEYLLA